MTRTPRSTTNGISLLLYVSDHGFGHAARTSALATALLRSVDLGALAIAVPRSYWPFFDAALRDPRCEAFDLPTDLGIPLRPQELLPDPPHVARTLEAWLAQWPALLESQSRIFSQRSLDGVAVDASPLGCALASRLGLSSVLVSNFEWHAQYVGLGLGGAAVDAVGAAYASASAYLRYPLHLPSRALEPVPTWDVPACARTASDSEAAAVRGAFPGPRLLVSLGGLIDLPRPIELGAFAGSAVFTKGVRVSAPNAARVFDLSSELVDTLPHIAAADLVVTKGGWSTVAEAAVAKRPLLLVERRSVPEDRHIAEAVARLGLGRSCPLADISDAIGAALAEGPSSTPGLPNAPDAVAAKILSRFK